MLLIFKEFSNDVSDDDDDQSEDEIEESWVIFLLSFLFPLLNFVLNIHVKFIFFFLNRLPNCKAPSTGSKF